MEILCRDCNKLLPESSFYKKLGKYRYPNCKVCFNIQHEKKRIERKYKISFKNYEDLRAKQNYRCALCGRHEDLINSKVRKLEIDHDHETGKVRGLLCRTCNSTILGTRDKPFFERVLAYLGD